MGRRLAVRKVLRLARELRFVNYVVLISLSLSAIGFALYLLYIPSTVVLMEGFVWLVEALTFFGLLITFRIAVSKAVFYGARYEIFRTESFAVIIVAIAAGAITLFNIVHAFEGMGEGHLTPITVSSYLLASAAISYVLSRKTKSILERRKILSLTVKTVEEKLSLDVVFEAGAGIAILASNIIFMPIIENIAAIIMGFYVIIGLILIAKDAFLNLIGIGVPKLINKTRREVFSIIRRTTFFKPRRVRITSLGSFAEAEIWLEARPDLTLNEAYRHSVTIAREVIRRVGRVIRAIVIIIPQLRKSLVKQRTPIRYQKVYPRQYKEKIVKSKVKAFKKSEGVAFQKSRSKAKTIRPSSSMKTRSKGEEH
ncbi:MAG: cobalt transporter [Thermoprotei archaeon]|nr:MAG: cobalt transporter [Thermoprotei archaeon]